MKAVVITGLSTLFIFFYSASASTIYHCKNSEGQSIYSDQECEKNHVLIKTMEVNISSTPNATPLDTKDKALETLYVGKVNSTGSRFLRVSIYEETDAYIIFYIEAFYNGLSNATVQFRVMPNTDWDANFFESSKYGINKGYSRVALGSKAKDIETSDILRLEVWQDIQGKPINILEKKVIPYKKEWRKE